MDTRTTSEATQRRNWVVLLYFYVAALVGLGLVITGTTIALFGAKTVALPELGLSSYTFESSLPRDDRGTVAASETERQAARDNAIRERRSEGANDLINGTILLVVGLPIMIWHLRRGRRVGTAPGQSPGPAPMSEGA